MKLTDNKALAFTLTEIMATLAIIVIITFISMPFVSNYITQSKVADAINAAASLQTLITAKVAANESITNSGTGLTLPATLGVNVASFSVTANGVINLTTSDTANNISLTLTPAFNATNQDVSWVCAVTDADLNSFVPSQCRI